jgi:uncharacterized membrane protein YdjX (TVP38/TMEM64 family)
VSEWAAAVEAVIRESGSWAYLLACGYTVAVAIVPFPAEFPAMLNGALFGPILGTAITWSAALVGAQASFELSRRFGRPLVDRVIPAEMRRRADRLVLASGAAGLLLLRLTPIVAFTAVNWLAGLTPLRRWTFIWTTAVGIVPGAILFTVSGSGLAVLYRRHPAVALALLILAIGVALSVRKRMRRGHRP